ncbi:MAG: porphobilinogen synthase [Verrucomicrobiota bacterium]|nr:porphobilinogen synthase [Verrucomicrobiota bacterium]
MLEIPIRLRRNRRTEAIRQMVQETELRASDLIAPFFIIEGERRSQTIPSLPEIERVTVDRMVEKAERLHRKGVQAIALFPALESGLRTEGAEEAWNSDGLIPRAIREIKKEIPSLCVIADVALDPYTSHGHDGLVNERGEILNDETIECLIKMAMVQAEAGIDLVAPSDMMDGRVRAIREALDKVGKQHVGVLAYSAKYASSLYAPFREALDVRLKFGDKKSYQLNPANVREALLEAKLDEEEGADILLVKPALFYLDIIARLRQQTNRPIAAYHVSGEYAMVMAAGQLGYLDPTRVFHEALVSIKRAGADLIFTYAAERVLAQM